MKVRTTLFIILLSIVVLALPRSIQAGPKEPTNDFMIRIPASEVEGIASRNGLEVIRVVEASADGLGRSVYEVRAPQEVSAAQVIALVQATEPEAVGIEEVFPANLPESYVGPDLDQQTSRASLPSAARR